MDLTSHPPHRLIPAPCRIEDACGDCGEPRTAGHVCKGGGTR